MKDILEKMPNEGLHYSMNRRKFIKISSLASAGLMIGTSCDRWKTSSAKARIVIVGGGAAGMSMAAHLTHKLENPNITLIDPSDRQYYQPGFTLLAAGVYEPDYVWKKQSTFIPDDVKWVKDYTLGIDPVKKKVTTQANGSFDYDFLLLTPGLQMNFNQVEGISRSTLGTGNAHCIYDFVGAQNMWKAIQDFGKTGGRAVYTNTYTKLKCGGAPKKIAMLTEHYCRKQGTREKATFAYYNASKEIFDTPFYAKRLVEIFDERHIDHNPQHRLKGIDTDAKVAHFINKANDEEIKVEYDLLHFVPPMSAPDFVGQSGLGWTEGSLKEGNWAMVDKHTLVHKTFPEIICLGDCAGIPTSKTSAAVRMQVPIAMANLISLMEGGAPEASYDGYTACPIVTEYGKVLMCEFDYDKNPKPSIPFVDPAHEQAIAWGVKKYMIRNIYFTGMMNGWM